MDFGGEPELSNRKYSYLIESFEPKPLIPVILLHGLAGSRTSQSGSCRDMASHGYIVFSIDHNDGSAHYC